MIALYSSGTPSPSAAVDIVQLELGRCIARLLGACGINSGLDGGHVRLGAQLGEGGGVLQSCGRPLAARAHVRLMELEVALPVDRAWRRRAKECLVVDPEGVRDRSEARLGFQGGRC